MLKITNLKKTYKLSKKVALKGVSFEVKDGEVFGIIGRNGAGKSTIIKCILGILPYDEGEIVLNGLNAKTNENEVKKLIGYVPDNHLVYESLTGREYINFMADIYGVKKEMRDELSEKYIKLFDLTEDIDKQISGYSHGMHQKICIIGALIHSPKLWVLDEPFLGLDPRGMNMLKKSIETYIKNKENIVLFSSHNLDTVVEMCNRVCVIDNGIILDIFDMSQKTEIAKLKKIML